MTIAHFKLILLTNIYFYFETAIWIRNIFLIERLCYLQNCTINHSPCIVCNISQYLAINMYVIHFWLMFFYVKRRFPCKNLSIKLLNKSCTLYKIIHIRWKKEDFNSRFLFCFLSICEYIIHFFLGGGMNIHICFPNQKLFKT